MTATEVHLEPLEVRVVTLENSLASIKSDISEIKNSLASSTVNQAGNRRYAWGLAIGALPVIFSLFGVMFFIVRQQTQADISSAVRDADTRLTTITAQNATSITERSELRANVSVLQQLVSSMASTLQAEMSERKSHEIEIETQFRAADQVRNIQFANQLRYNALMWEKVYGQRYPDAVEYYPTISK